MKTGRLDNTQTRNRTLETETPARTGEVARAEQAVKSEGVTGNAPIPESTLRRAAGKVDAGQRAQILELAASALGRITEAVRTFHGLDHVSRDGRENKYDGGERPAKLPKVLARVSQDFAALKEAAALVESGQVDRAAAGEIGRQLDDFLMIHAAMVRTPKPQWKYETEGSYLENMKRLQAKMGEIWSLAPSFLGKEAVAKLERQWMPAMPADYLPAKNAAGVIWETAGGYLWPGAGKRDATLEQAVQLVRDNLNGAEFIREGGRYSVALTGHGTRRFVSNRGEIPIAKAEVVEKAARALIKEMSFDDTVPIHVHHPGVTPARLEEAWSVLDDALTTRDFISEPKSGSDYHLRRWSENLELQPPKNRGLEGYSGPSLQVLIYGNDDPSSRRDASSRFADGMPDRVQSDLSNYLWTRGFKDVHVQVEVASRDLDEATAKTLAGRIDAARKNASGALEKITGVTVEDGVYGSGREVVVHIDGGQEQLRPVETAVRELLSDRASTGTPIRIQTNVSNSSDTQWSSLFGQTTTTDSRKHRWERYQKAVSEPDPYAASREKYALERRTKLAEQIGAKGEAHAALAASLTKGLDGVFANLEAYLLGKGKTDPAWQSTFEKLPVKDQADFLELAMIFRADTSKAPRSKALEDALVTLRRVDGRVTLEHLYQQNGTQVPEHLAQTDRVLRQGLAGPALENALAAVKVARGA